MYHVPYVEKSPCSWRKGVVRAVMVKNAKKVETVEQATGNLSRWQGWLEDAENGEYYIIKDKKRVLASEEAHEKRKRKCRKVIAQYTQQRDNLLNAVGTPASGQVSRTGQACSLSLMEAASTTQTVTMRASVREERKESVKETTVERVKMTDGQICHCSGRSHDGV